MGVWGVGDTSRRAVAAAAVFPPSPFFLKSIWGPPLVSDSWPRTTAVAPPIPRGCCLLGLEDLIPHSPTFLPQGMGPLHSKQTLGPKHCVEEGTGVTQGTSLEQYCQE